jgi:hypothetical protein
MNPQRLLLTGTLAVMPRRKYPREGLVSFLLVILLLLLGWTVVIWLNHL